jgi:O-antigen/teichoic acid export membrane protein
MSFSTIATKYFPSFLHPLFDRIKRSPIGLRFARGVFWSMAGAVISRGLMLAATVLVARLLGRTVYGELGMIQSTVGMLGVFAGFGLGLTATKHVAEFRKSDPARAGRIIGLSGLFAMASGGIIALGLFIFAPWLAEHTINAPYLADDLRIGALILFLSALNGAQTGALSGFEAFKTIARVNLFVGLISFPVLVLGAYFGGLTGAVWALVINLCFNWLLNHMALRKEALRFNVPFKYKHCSREWPVLWKFSLPAALSGALIGPVNWTCAALLVNRPDGYGEMGIYSVGNQWRIAILFIPFMLGHVILPILSNINGESDGRQYRKVLKLNVFLNISIALSVVIPVILFAHLVMSAYGPAFERGVSVLRVMAFSAVLMAANHVVSQVITSKGKMWVTFTFNALWAAVLLASASLLLQKGYGALGLAYASLIAYCFNTLCLFGFVYYLLAVVKSTINKDMSTSVNTGEL